MNTCLQIAKLENPTAAASGFNFVFSPLSLTASLSLTTFNARGETLRQLLSFLGCPTLDHLHSAFDHLSQAVIDNFMTKTDNFYLLNGSTTQRPFMSSREDQFISFHDGFKVLKLLYKEGDSQDSRSFSIVLFLPNERNDLHDLIKVVASC
ncbi:putative non-inhibitory serpin-Z5 [Platanthera guangdongensis]|uniref:Non-inhibitory serpin-Z5 n=1 Tax=Platanthera guangdongensis TaxID=2320717 RepID=A0ABR2MVR1_9ASPA